LNPETAEEIRTAQTTMSKRFMSGPLYLCVSL
jgi:hypothetical protein